MQERVGHHGGAELRWRTAEAAEREKVLARQRARRIMLPETARAVTRATPWEAMSEEAEVMRRKKSW